MKRKANIQRKTKETDIKLGLDIDGSGKTDISIPYAFLGHMLESFAKHARFDMELKASGDTDVGCHHTIEDIGICLGKAINFALGDKEGIKRFGFAIIPMDDAQVTASVDLGGRPYLRYNVDMPYEMIEGVETLVFRDFFEAISYNALVNLHISKNAGLNPHHIIEAMFKSVGIALNEASRIVNPGEMPSTKGVL